MPPQLYLIAPATLAPRQAAEQVSAVLEAASFAALLVQRGSLDDAGYAELAEALVRGGQAAGCAVLLENDVDLAIRLAADGVHVTAGLAALQSAIAALKPRMIVGAGALATRHDAMTAGEMDVDYVFFGPLDGASDPAAGELAEWWAATFEVPAVLADPQAIPGSDARGAEFLALSTSIWAAGDPAAAARAMLAPGHPA